MSNENKLHTYFLSYNLCSVGTLDDKGCIDYHMYIRTKTSFNKDSLEQRFGKSGFKFNLYTLEELDDKRIQELNFDLNAILILD